MPTNPSALPTIPPFPALSDRAAGTYNSKAYTWATEWGATVAPALFTYATVTYNNAVEAATSAGTASTAAGTATTKAAEAVAAATAATSAPGTSGTSTSSLTLAVGAISFTTQTGKVWVPGMNGVLARTSDPSRRALGYLNSYDSGTGAVSFQATSVEGSGGPFTDWTFSHAGAQGPAGAAGAPGASAGWLFVSSTALAGLSTADFTYDTAYDYLHVLEGVTTTTNNSDVWFRVSIDSGATFKAGATDYAHSRFGIYASASGGAGSTGDTKIILSGGGIIGGINNTSGGSLNGEVSITNLASTTRNKNVSGRLAHRTTSDGIFSLFADGAYVTGQDAVTNGRFLPSASTFAAGVILTYRRARS